MVKPINSDGLRSFFERAVALNPRSMIELLEIRRGLELQSALLAARNASVTQAAAMRDLCAEMRQHLYAHDVYAGLDLRLHLQIALASGNTLMYYLIESIRDVLTDSIREGLRSRFTEAQMQQVQSLHETLVEAISAGDAEAAAAAMAAHFDDAINAINLALIRL
jgi:DNA-binding FadR family transcriptional regulator